MHLFICYDKYTCAVSHGRLMKGVCVRACVCVRMQTRALMPVCERVCVGAGGRVREAYSKLYKTG